MNCMNAVDTNVLVYFVDRDEPTKRAKAVELLDRLGKEGEDLGHGTQYESVTVINPFL